MFFPRNNYEVNGFRISNIIAYCIDSLVVPLGWEPLITKKKKENCKRRGDHCLL